MIIYGNPSYDTLRSIKDSNLLKEWGRLGVFSDLKHLPYPDMGASIEELEYMIDIQKTVTPERLAYIKRVDEHLYDVMSEFLMWHGVTESADLIKQNITVYEPVIDYLKAVYNRPRPNQLAGYLGIPLYPLLDSKIAGSASYPSGHTLFALFFYHIYGKRHPELSEKILQFAMDVKRTREEGGVHYPSDGLFSLKVYKHLAPWIDARTSIYSKGIDKLSGY